MGSAAIFSRALGAGHPDTLTARHNLAAVHRSAHRTQHAIDLFKSVLADHTRLLGPDHPDTGSSRENLAEAYQPQNFISRSIKGIHETVAKTAGILDT